MPKIIDLVNRDWGMFIQGSGIGGGRQWMSGLTGDVNPSHTIYENACGRGKMMSSEQGPDAMGWQRTFSPGRNNYAICDSYLHIGRAMGGTKPREGWSAATRATYWATAAAGTNFPNGHNIDNYLMRIVNEAVSAGIKYLPIRINRESPAPANEAPILNAQESADNVTLWRRMIPQMRAAAEAGGMKIKFIWNACGGPDTSYPNQLLGFPGWDMIDGIGPDVYTSAFLNGVMPIVPLWKNLTVRTAITQEQIDAAGTEGLFTITRNSYEAPLSANDEVTVGVGTANAENLVVASSATIDGIVHITFKTKITKPHRGVERNDQNEIVYEGDRITYRYAAGDIMHNYGAWYRSKTSNNTAAPATDAWVENAAWQPIGYFDLPEATQLAAVTKWRQVFNRSWYGQQTNGTVDAQWYVQKWYDFAAGTLPLTGLTFDPRVDTSLRKRLEFHLPEFGVMGRPDTDGQTAGDAFIWMSMVMAWSAAMKARDGIGVTGAIVWNHDDGYEQEGDVPRSVYSLLPPNIKGTTMSSSKAPAPGRWFPQAGDTYLKLIQPGAQLRVARRGFGATRISGESPKAPALPVPSAPVTPVSPSGEAMPASSLPNWNLVMTEDFTRNAPLGQFKTVNGEGWAMDWGRDTSANDGNGDGVPDSGRAIEKTGLYASPHVVSVSNSVLRKSLKTKRTESDTPNDTGIAIGTPLVAALTPLFGATGTWAQLYGRYAVRFRASQTETGPNNFKLAWLLWPADPNGWGDGEVDFPEGGLGGTIEGFSHQVDGNPSINQWSINTGISMANWHTCVIEWTPTVLRFIIDGVVRETTDTQAIPKVPCYWNLQTETNLGGTAPPDTATGTVEIDWVAAWSWNG